MFCRLSGLLHSQKKTDPSNGWIPDLSISNPLPKATGPWCHEQMPIWLTWTTKDLVQIWTKGMHPPSCRKWTYLAFLALPNCISRLDRGQYLSDWIQPIEFLATVDSRTNNPPRQTLQNNFHWAIKTCALFVKIVAQNNQYTTVALAINTVKERSRDGRGEEIYSGEERESEKESGEDRERKI